MRLKLLAASLLAAASWADVVTDVRVALAKNNLPLAQGLVQNYRAQLGITPEMFAVRNWTVDKGVGISDADVRSGTREVVIGAKIADQYFYKQDPIGQIVRIEGQPFTVIGVLAGRG